jgi:hypothetical protein
LRSIENFENEIEAKESEVRKLGRDIKETEKDESLPPHKRRQRRKNEDGVLEKPWPREYNNERRVLNNKIAAGNAYNAIRTEKARAIQSQHDFFNALVQTMSNLQPQTCPVCLDEKVFLGLMSRARVKRSLCCHAVI